MFAAGRKSRLVIALAALVAALGVVSAAAAQADSTGGAEAAKLTKLKIAYGNQTIDFMQLVVGQKAGIYAKNGLDVELVNGTGGKSPALLEAGQTDIAVSNAKTFLVPVAKGAKLSLLSVNLNRYTFKLVGKNSITSVKQLAGKTLALSSPTGSVGVAGIKMLENAGLDVKSVKIVYISNVAARLAALRGGSVDAMIASPPVASVLQGGGLHVIYDLSAMRDITISSWAETSWAKDNVDTIKRYIRADIEAVAWMKDPKNEKKVKQYIGEFVGFTDTPSINEGYETLLKEFQPEPLLDPKALSNSMEEAEASSDTKLDRNSFLFLEPLQQVVTYRLNARLTAAQQIPRAKPRSNGSATFTGTLSPTGRLTWKISPRRLSSKITRIELYVGAPGKVGKAALQVCASTCPPSGSKAVGKHALERTIKEDGAYVVVQTKKHPKGEIRGQLKANFG